MYRNEIVYKFGINIGKCKKSKIINVEDEDKFEEEEANNIEEDPEEEMHETLDST